MNTTVRLKASQITKDWRVIDAADRPLGRVAAEVAALLRGKHKPTFEPHLDGGDFVIVVNAARVRVTGRKRDQMTYYRHSGYPGGLKARSFEDQLARFPEKVIERAVRGMLPSGPLGEAMFHHMKVYKGPDHPHQSQVVGSERAVTAREAARKETMSAPMKPARLHPLRGRVDRGAAAEEAEALVEETIAAAVMAETPPVVEEATAGGRAARRRRASSETSAAAESSAPTDEDESDAQELTEETVTAAVMGEEPPAVEEAVEAKPARRSRSKKTEAGDTTPTEEEE